MCDVYRILHSLQQNELWAQVADLKRAVVKGRRYHDTEENIKWREIFYRFFVEDMEAEHDDMLFFVRGQENREDETVYVARKPSVPKMILDQSSKMMWKESLFLNLIVQMPCRLLVTIFEKTGSAVGSTKDKCIVKQRISKHVYALPNKPQSAKSKGVNIESPVYSWPHIYFVVDDFEDMLEDVRLQPNEYVLIELSTYIRTKQRHAHKKIRKSPKSWLASGAESREKYELKRKNNLPVFGRQKHLNREENDSNIVEKEVVLFKGATSYETLVGMYTQRHNNGNLISKLRNTSYSTEFLVLQDPRRTSCTQIALKGGKNSPNLCSKVFDFEDKLGLRYSHSNPALRNLTKPPNSPEPCIELVLKSSEQLHCPQPIRPIKSPQFSHLITTSPLRRHSSNLHPHQSSLQIEKSLSTYHQPGSPHDKNNLYFFTSCLTDSVLVCNETSRRNDSNPLSKWLQRLTSPFMFDSYARPSSADQRSSNSPESLHFFINHISIHWSDIVNDIFDAKRQVDHY